MRMSQRLYLTSPFPRYGWAVVAPLWLPLRQKLLLKNHRLENFTREIIEIEYFGKMECFFLAFFRTWIIKQLFKLPYPYLIMVNYRILPAFRLKILDGNVSVIPVGDGGQYRCNGPQW